MKERILALAGFVLRASPLVLLSPAAFAYVGPGAGLSALGSVLALIGSFFLLFVGFLWYPLKRMFRRGSRSEQLADSVADGEFAADEVADPADRNA